MLQIRNVLFPTDRTAWSKSVFEHAAFYAGRHEAELHALTLTWNEANGAAEAASPDTPTAFRTSLDEAARTAAADLVESEVQALSPDTGILDYAENHGVDLIVMATHGLGGWEHALLGSVTEQTLRRALCPVLSLRAAAVDEAV